MVVMPPRLTSLVRIVPMVVMRGPRVLGPIVATPPSLFSPVNGTKGRAGSLTASNINANTAADTGEPGLAGPCRETAHRLIMW